MPESHADVLVVGAGLSGLTCARALERAGLRPLILEASDDVGGRARTDVVDGFRLDRGFQVLLTAYETAADELDYGRLDLRAFEPGALVWCQGRFHRVSDPFRRPAHALASLRAPIGTLADKLRVAALALRLRGGSVDDLFLRPETTTRERLRELGFSSRMIDTFFRPFLGGVFLDPELETSSRMFEFVFRMFASGAVTVPARGMGALAVQMAVDLPEECVRLNARVESVEPAAVILAGGERLQARAVVLATDARAAARLVDLRDPGHHSVLCLYFAAEEPPLHEGILALDGEGRGPVTNLAVMSRVSPEYAPPGRELVSATVLAGSLDRAELGAAARAQLRGWFGSAVDGWEEVAAYRIEDALPDQSPRAGGVGPRSLLTDRGIHVAGDHRRHGSIEGAVRSGREVAAAVVRALTPS